MQARHRIGPENGYRSNAMGIRGGVAAASRIPPEGSIRGHQVFNSESGNYNCDGYVRGGGQSRQFQALPYPPRRTDIFVEAGRLAAEYLVSQVKLPQNALSVKWHNDGLKNKVGNFQGFRAHETVQVSLDGRESANSCLRNSAPDAGSGGRRYSDEYNSVALRNSVRGKTGSSNNYEREVDIDSARSGSWAERSMASPGTEADREASLSLHNEQLVGKYDNVGTQASAPGGITHEGIGAIKLEWGLDKCNSVEDGGAKASSGNEKLINSDATGGEYGMEKCNSLEDGDAKESSSNENGLKSDADRETIKGSDDANKFDVEMVKEGRNDNDLERKVDENMEVTASVEGDSVVSVDNANLLKHSKFQIVSTEGSSLAIKDTEGEQDPVKEDETNTERELSEGAGICIVDVGNSISAGNASFNKKNESKSCESDVFHAQAMEKELDVMYTTKPGQCSRSGISPDITVEKEREPNVGLPGFGSSNSMIKKRVEKRILDDHIDCRERSKKLREWVPSMDALSNGCLLPLSSSMGDQPTLHEQRTSQSSHVTLSPKQKSLYISLLPEEYAESRESMQEKQLFPGSFKTFDLNLVGNCDVNQNHDADSVHIFPSVSETQKEATHINVDLCMSNNCNLPKRNGNHETNDTDIKVNDLENDSAQEDQTSSNPETRGFLMTMTQFICPPKYASTLIQIGCNFMEVCLHCSSFNDEWSFLRTWEQPTQDCGKPF
ncbi:uncharacterized protein At4g26450-like isoform X1 [Sesamum indicum]|uniref:Uncharacterized protein At4g26450-like isoform X1 n=1 Tax=Sesamum indicum TaxID=4182 RepID=A0A6I9UHX0_SESIN|nr:uncharacterized protein At4g26450-like isoform X1 [Sesamum indicum]XP_020554396.1 uncharacterized protein At4g26450-like isoform X1 [Sesamum indicum]XP_020554397.1 uncharacterized protein At4g26450-like isoform X1 [Sesamum indicum]